MNETSIVRLFADNHKQITRWDFGRYSVARANSRENNIKGIDTPEYGARTLFFADGKCEIRHLSLLWLTRVSVCHTISQNANTGTAISALLPGLKSAKCRRTICFLPIRADSTQRLYNKVVDHHTSFQLVIRPLIFKVKLISRLTLHF